ncbi:homocysteine S-methyltransferase family protein, partial [Streptomyces niveus]|uniref:homocysteine S-methyltransferase family protein n=1 Tax=Streptomyces niveus TaxID=193462 RepID=UPI00368C1DC5
GGGGGGGGRAPRPPLFTSDRVRGWQSAGARLLGGCCRVGPARIADIAALLDAERGDG